MGSHVSRGDGCGLVAVGLNACHDSIGIGHDERGGERLMGCIGIGTVVEGVGDGASGGALPAVFGQQGAESTVKFGVGRGRLCREQYRGNGQGEEEGVSRHGHSLVE